MFSQNLEWSNLNMESVAWSNLFWKSSKKNIKMMDNYCSNQQNLEYNECLTDLI